MHLTVLDRQIGNHGSRYAFDGPGPSNDMHLTVLDRQIGSDGLAMHLTVLDRQILCI